MTPSLTAHQLLDNWLESTNGVVAPTSTAGNIHPVYDGPYPILYDAEGDPDFGLLYNMTIDGELLQHKNSVKETFHLLYFGFQSLNC